MAVQPVTWPRHVQNPPTNKDLQAFVLGPRLGRLVNDTGGYALEAAVLLA
jgi:hypothetical protein